ncbi:hypothetical protein HB852_01310 [Listeria grandensis]|uniref:Heavy metal-binding domain-containing protein n=1 Tax=Listeria grandensis TaxID=1494963 RepID=A0A7X0Y294_9LIST|nr:hypothetical protein [Listeria grandensis]MBC1473255.1 hypothetical protein [Listeria grandensis]MBC1935284.1 hypothetical protein [Listeria grandensis]
MGIFKNEADENRDDVLDRNVESVLVSTGPTAVNHDVVKVVFVRNYVQVEPKAGWSATSDFSGLVRGLQEQAHELGGDAVLNCHFDEQFIREENGKLLLSQVGYGTVVMTKITRF